MDVAIKNGVRKTCGNGSGNYFGCGAVYIKLQVITLHRATHSECTHNQGNLNMLCGLYQCQVPGFDILMQDV